MTKQDFGIYGLLSICALGTISLGLFFSHEQSKNTIHVSNKSELIGNKIVSNKDTLYIVGVDKKTDSLILSK